MHEASVHKYPMVRGSGAFLVCVGLGLILSVLLPGNGPVNGRILGVAAILGIAAMPVVRRRFPLGRPTAVHILTMTTAVALELFLFWLVFSRLPKDTAPQVRWLWALLLVGLHFVPMGLALGKRAVLLGVACVAVASSGLFLGILPFTSVVVLDGILKLGFGVSMALTGIRSPAGR